MGEAGGGGGAATGLSLVTANNGRSPVVVVGGGGGASGGSGLNSGQAGAPGVQNPTKGSGGQTTHQGDSGWRSAGGGGGGGGAGGWFGGNGGRGGSYWGDDGGRGWGGSSYTASSVTGTVWSTGGAPPGDGYLVLVPVLAGRPTPTVTTYGCNAGTKNTYTVPAGTLSVSVTATGAAGSTADFSLGGAGGQVQAAVRTTPGQKIGVIAGCAGGQNGIPGSQVGVGYGNGGVGGLNKDDTANDGGGGGGGSAVLFGSTPVIVAGGGGGGGGNGTIFSSTFGGDGGNGGNPAVSGSSGSGSSSGGGGGGGRAGGINGTGGSDSGCAGGGGGGGGGLNGGKGGNAGSCTRAGGGGGGGTSYAAASYLTTPASFGTSVQTGSGLVTLVAAPATVPDAPTTVTAVAGNGQATVSYSPGLFDGGAGPVSYRVLASPGGPTAQGTGNSLVVNGLVNGVSYTFTVQASNQLGYSAPSAPSNPVVPVGAPAAPTNVTVTPGNGSASVAFAAPFNGGSPITRYAVAVYQAGSTLPFYAYGTSSPVLLPALTNGVSYTVTVAASNALYDGPPSVRSGPFAPSTAPEAPGGVNAVPGDGQAVVSFVAPTSTGGAPITGYTVTSSPGGLTATGTGSPITMPGLANGTPYTFTVAATNLNGTGPISAPSASVIPGRIPSPPLLVTVRPGDGKAVVNFHLPLDDGGAPITGYTVTSSPGGLTASGTAGPITVTGLTNGTPYTFTVTATNDAGTSQPSPASSPVIPTAASTAGPANDDFADAQTIPGDPTGSTTGSNVAATVQPDEPAADPYHTSGATIWYKWAIPTGGGAVQFDLCGSGLTGTMGVFQDTDGTLADLTVHTPGRLTTRCADGSTAPAIVFDLNADGGTYYIDVAGIDNGTGPSQGTVQLNWQPSNAGG